MPRLHTVDPAAAQGPVKEMLEGPLKGKHFNIFKAMANSPGALGAYLALSGAVSKGTLSEMEREVIQLAVGQANGCAYCVDAHTAIGRKAGLTAEQTLEARRGRMSDARLDAIARFVIALNEKRGHVSDEDVAAMRGAGYNDANIADAVAVFALAVYTNVFNHVNETVSDFPAAPRL